MFVQTKAAALVLSKGQQVMSLTRLLSRPVRAGVALAAAMSMLGAAGVAAADIQWETSPTAHTIHVIHPNLTYFTSAAGGGDVLDVDRMQDETGRDVVCIDFSKASPDGMVVNPQAAANTQYAYLTNVLNHPESSTATAGLNNADMSYYIVQAATHMYDSTQFATLTDASGGPINDPYGLIPRIRQLKAEADQAQAQSSYEQHSVNVTADTGMSDGDPSVPEGTVGADGLWTSREFTVHVDAKTSTPTVTASFNEAGLAADAQLLDATTGESVTTVTDGQQVVITASPDAVQGQAASISVHLAATFKGAPAVVAWTYASDAGHQDVIRNEELTFTDDMATDFSADLEAVVGSVKGHKTGSDGANLAGVEFTLTPVASDNAASTPPDASASASTSASVTADGSMTATTSEDGSFSFTDLPWGHYTLTETKTAAGYDLLTSPIDVVIDSAHRDIDLGTVVNHKTDNGGGAAQATQGLAAIDTGVPGGGPDVPWAGLAVVVAVAVAGGFGVRRMAVAEK